MRTRFIYGADTVESLGEIALEFSPKSVLLVTDPGIVQAGHTGRAIQALEASHIKVTVFDSVIENPTTHEVQECVSVAREAEADLIVGVGGGSTMDTAKGCNFILSNGGKMQDYWGVGKATKPMLPLILVPTTAGTGSEAQSFALIADAETHQKMACGDPKASAAVAILDPTLTLSQPAEITALTGIDAISHALESAVTKKRNEFSAVFSREAFRLTFGNMLAVLEDPDNLEARSNMLLGACYAGTAIENSMLGAAHALANPLTAKYGVTHGLAIAMTLPQVVRHNAEEPNCAKIYAELAGSVNLVNDETPREERGAEWIIKIFQEIVREAALRDRFDRYEIDSEAIPELAADAETQWTGKFNPREVGATDFEQLYTRILSISNLAGV